MMIIDSIKVETLIRRSGKAQKKTIGDILSEPWRSDAIEKVNWCAALLEIDKNDIYCLPFPSNAAGSVDGVNIAVKQRFGSLLKKPAIMAKILGGKDK